jgi:hypothetical protein
MTLRLPLLPGLLLLSAACCAPALAAETGTLLRNADLKARPFLDAETVAKLPERAAVEVLARQGPWMQVRYNGRQGYVRMLQVRLSLSDTALARAPAAVSAVPAVNRPSSGSSPMVTTGVRGFDEQGLKDAEPDPEQFQQMVDYAVSAAHAHQFAQGSQLTARQVPYYDQAGAPVKGGK